jgi:hypothetical protein
MRSIIKKKRDKNPKGLSNHHQPAGKLMAKAMLPKTISKKKFCQYIPKGYEFFLRGAVGGGSGRPEPVLYALLYREGV